MIEAVNTLLANIEKKYQSLDSKYSFNILKWLKVERDVTHRFLDFFFVLSGPTSQLQGDPALS